MKCKQAYSFISIFTVSLISFVVSGCKVSGDITDLFPEVVHNFKASYIETPANGRADNSTILSVKVYLVDEDGTKISGFTPSISATMTGLSFLGCDASNSAGMSTCSFRSSEPGTFSLSVSNPTITSAKSITFDPIRPQLAAVNSGGNQQLTGTGWTVRATLAEPGSQTVLTGPGWVFHMGIQGSLNTE